MAHLTLTIDDDLLRRARIRALEQGESVNGLVRTWLERFADRDAQVNATEAIIEISRRAGGSSGAGGRDWTRDDAYSERVER